MRAARSVNGESAGAGRVAAGSARIEVVVDPAWGWAQQAAPFLTDVGRLGFAGFLLAPYSLWFRRAHDRSAASE